jgi:hypothetical protein
MDIWEVYYTPFSDTPTWICVQHKLLLRCILYATFEATALRKPRNRSRAKAKAIWASIWTFAKTGTPFFVTKKMVDLTWFKEQKLVICVGLWWSHLLEKRIVYIYVNGDCNPICWKSKIRNLWRVNPRQPASHRWSSYSKPYFAWNEQRTWFLPPLNDVLVTKRYKKCSRPLWYTIWHHLPIDCQEEEGQALLKSAGPDSKAGATMVCIRPADVFDVCYMYVYSDPPKWGTLKDQGLVMSGIWNFWGWCPQG